MPTTYEDIKKTSILRNRIGRRKVGLYEEGARYATGGGKRPAVATASKKFSKSKRRGTFTFGVNGGLSSNKRNADK